MLHLSNSLTPENKTIKRNTLAGIAFALVLALALGLGFLLNPPHAYAQDGQAMAAAEASDARSAVSEDGMSAQNMAAEQPVSQASNELQSADLQEANVSASQENAGAVGTPASDDKAVGSNVEAAITGKSEAAASDDDDAITTASPSSPNASQPSQNPEDAITPAAGIPEGYSAGWQLINNKWYYFDAAGKAKTGWLKSGGAWYYLDPADAAMRTGLYQVGDAWYASNESGAMAANKWIKLGNDWYYATASGALKTGWHKSGGKWYWLEPSKNGCMASESWVKDGEAWYYLSASGAMKTGWQLYKNSWYYLNASGAMFTGWKKLAGTWYYLDPASEGKMKTGHYQVGDTWYVSSASGAMAANNWAQVGSDWYYATASGALKTGWHKSGGKWYWLSPEKQGLMASGTWINDGKADYFMMKSGAMFTGWLSQGSADGLANGMFFDKQKVIDIALAEVGYREKATDAMLDEKFANAGPGNHTKYGRDMNKIDPLTMDYADAWCDAFVDWCFVQAFGVENARGLLGGAFNDYTPVSAQLFKDQMSWYTSAPQVGDQVFFQSSERINHTGIVYSVKNGKIYTVEGNSSDQVAKREYALNAARIAGYGRPLYNNRGDDGKFVAAKEWCYLDASGARASGWIKSEGNWHYLDPATGLMVRGKKVIDGKTYSFDTAGVMKTGWAKESSKWYYYDTSGAMQTNCWIEDSYYVDANGVMAVNTWIGDKYVGADGKYVPGKQK